MTADSEADIDDQDSDLPEAGDSPAAGRDEPAAVAEEQ